MLLRKKAFFIYFEAPPLFVPATTRSLTFTHVGWEIVFIPV
jgi:hypothetical protein